MRTWNNSGHFVYESHEICIICTNSRWIFFFAVHKLFFAGLQCDFGRLACKLRLAIRESDFASRETFAGGGRTLQIRGCYWIRDANARLTSRFNRANTWRDLNIEFDFSTLVDTILSPLEIRRLIVAARQKSRNNLCSRKSRKTRYARTQ